MKKRLNRKGFTLIELLAVIVVLAIILVITVPMVLNTLGSTRQDALQSSANSVADFYRSQLQLKALGKDKGEANFLTDISYGSDGSVSASTSERCITTNEADILGLNTTDYAISTTTSTCSTVSWTATGKVTVVLKGNADSGQFAGLSATGTK